MREHKELKGTACSTPVTQSAPCTLENYELEQSFPLKGQEQMHNDRKDSFRYVLEKLTAARTGMNVTEYTEELKKTVE